MRNYPCEPGEVKKTYDLDVNAKQLLLIVSAIITLAGRVKCIFS